MNREKFINVQSTLNIKRTLFKIPYNHKTTFNTGELVPIFYMEAVPGDTFKIDLAALIRMSTPIKPVMDNAWADIQFYAVPMRLVWEHWEEFMGANKSGPWTQQTIYTIPQITSPASTGWTKGTIADHMGIPTGIPGQSVSALPFRGISLIWNEWFRDENIQNFTYMNTGDATTTGTNGTNYVTDPVCGGACLPVCKKADYFTKGLPEPQKGPDVLLPLGTTATVKTANEELITGTSPVLKLRKGDGSVPDANRILATKNGGNLIDVASPAYSSGNNWELHPTNLYADLSNATAATINQLRLAFQVQKIYERDARGGTRYIELIKSHFGVTSSDARLQRPEYLGGKRIPITMGQVLQTSSTDSTSPQGNTAGYSLTLDNKEGYFTKSFDEHVMIFGFVCVRTDHTYSQGLEKFWSRKNRFDFYWPALANIGEQPILNKEIYSQGSSVVDTNGNPIDEQVFAYQEAFADYRYKPNQITGEFRPAYANNGGLSIWHYGDYYTSLPTLSEGWIKETKNNVDRTLAVQSATADQFQADFAFSIKAVRPMPYESTPGLIDHN